MSGLTILDGPIGTELARRGLPTPLPLWSAAAILDAPAQLGEIHADYAAAGAQVHTANTFRTDPWTLAKVGWEERAEELTRRAVEIARAAVPDDHLIAGSLSPLEDCYRPDLSPDLATCRREHSRSARMLVDAGVDLILCETFCHVGEALAALDAGIEHGVDVWLSLTPGPQAELLSPVEIVDGLREAARRGAAALLVNCGPIASFAGLVPQLAGLDLPFGAYANVGGPCSEQGWISEGPDSPKSYAQAAQDWLAAGASILGGCCGTSVQHIEALSRLA